MDPQLSEPIKNDIKRSLTKYIKAKTSEERKQQFIA